MTGTLNVQPLEEFCYTNTGSIMNYRLSGTDYQEYDFDTGNNADTASACMQPNLDVSVTKTAYPERETMSATQLQNSGLDISGATIGFDIDILNNGDIPITGIYLDDILQTLNLTNYFVWDSSSTNQLP